MQKFNFDYDPENDSLILFSPKTKSSGSVELGDFTLDYSSKKELVGIEISNASDFISSFTEKADKTAIKEILSNLEKCHVDIQHKGGWTIMKFFLLSKTEELKPIITTPSMFDSSPALACA